MRIKSIAKVLPGLLMASAVFAPSGSYAQVNWVLYQYDEGTMDENSRGFSGSRWGVLRKVFQLDRAEGAVDAIIRYEMVSNPYHRELNRTVRGQQEDVEWNDMVILVNGVEVARGTPIEFGTRGWHRVSFNPALLKDGENTIDFTWAEEERSESGRGGFSLGIDTLTTDRGRSMSSVDGGRTFTTEYLNTMFGRLSKEQIRPEWQGEYMVRLQVAFPMEVAPPAFEPGEWDVVFADGFERTDIFGPDWAVQSGTWGITGHLRALGPDAVIMSTRRLQTPFRIEYEAYSDNPGDLSLFLRRRIEDRQGYSVLFGATHNTENRISIPGEAIAVSGDKLIEAGRVHNVAVEVSAEGEITQTIDGREVLSAKAEFLPRQLYFGFYVWTEGVFDRVKVYSRHREVAAPPGAGLTDVREVRTFHSFNEYSAGEIPGDAHLKTAAGKDCSVRIADVPTWLYHNPVWGSRHVLRVYDENADPSQPLPDQDNKGARWIDDPCLELTDGSGLASEYASASLAVPAMRRGMIEFDLMAEHFEKGLHIKMGENTGLFFSDDGEFYWQAGADTIKLRSRAMLYSPSLGLSRFFLRPQLWYTIRIEFDLDMSLANVAFIRLFTGVPAYTKTEYLLLADDLPLPLSAVKNIQFRTSGPGRFFIDNVFFISRTEDLLDDAKWRKAAHQLMTAYYPLRKDPFHLKRFSMRNIRFMEGSGMAAGDELEDLRSRPEDFGVILGSAEKYNSIMVRQAFLAEKMRGVERAWYYGGELLNAFSGRMEAMRGLARKTEDLLEDLYRFYAECYIDTLNQGRMEEGFPARYAALETALKAAESSAERLLEDMRRQVARRARLRFTPYSIAPHDDHLEDRLEFSGGAFRRNGEKDYLFYKHARLIWPEMERTLLLSPSYMPSTIGAMLDTQEGEYYIRTQSPGGGETGLCPGRKSRLG